jgi:predicted transposase YdaD
VQLSAAYLKKREEWKEEGKMEEKLEAAMNLLREGSSLDFIARATGLPIATIQELRDRP